jgi:hypothetical protein
MKPIQKIIILVAIVVFLAAIVSSFFLMKSNKTNENTNQETSVTGPTEENPDIFFASNGKNTVYKIKKGNQWAVIWNGAEGKTYDFVSNPVFSFDGTQIAYNAEINGQAFVVVNNTQEIKAYQKANYITFSRDGSTIVFVATKGEDLYSVISAKISDINGTLNESQDYSEIGIAQDPDGNYSAIVISDDGQTIAYIVIEDGQTYIVINGEMSEGYDNIISVSFSEDGSIVYEAQDGDDVVTVINNEVVSTETTNTSTPNSVNPTTQVNNYHVNPNDTYRYTISTTKDIILDQDRLDYSTCSTDGQCNF